jgi:hypothetical protein
MSECCRDLPELVNLASQTHEQAKATRQRTLRDGGEYVELFNEAQLDAWPTETAENCRWCIHDFKWSVRLAHCRGGADASPLGSPLAFLYDLMHCVLEWCCVASTARLRVP